MTPDPVSPNWLLIIAVIQLIVVSGGVLGAFFVFKGRMEEMSKNQKELLEAFARRFEVHEGIDRDMFKAIEAKFELVQTRFLDIVGGLQRVVGETAVFRMKPRDSSSGSD